MNRYITILQSCGWVVLLLSLGSCSAVEWQKGEVKNGRLNLSEWNFQEQGMVSMSGNWEFYWKEKYTKIEDLPVRKDKEYMALPGFWGDAPTPSMGEEMQGYGTYHIKLTLPDTLTRHFLKLNSMYTAYELWGNGNLLFQSGKVGETEETTVPHFKTGLIELPQVRELDLFLQLASWEHRLGGGTLEKMLIGSERQIRTEWKNNITVQFGAFLFIITISFYLLSLYLLNREHKGYLYVALFAITGALRAICVDEMLVQELLPNFPYFLNQRIRYSGFFMSIGFVALFTQELFKVKGRTILSLGFYVAVLFSVMMFVFPFKYTCYISRIFQLIAIPVSLYCIHIIIKGLKKQPVLALIMLTGGVILFSTMIHTLLIVNGIINATFSYNFGYVIFICSQALSLAYLHNKHQLAASNLAGELLGLNKSLEGKVEERTLEIKEQREELRVQRDQIGIQAEKLRSANQQLQELDMAKTRFFANISHELRTPLTVILGNLRQLKTGVTGTSNEKHVEVSERQSILLTQLINQLLDITKLEAGKMKLNIRKESLIKLLRSYVYAFESLMAQKNIQLNFISNLSDYEGYVDRKALEKIMYNLLSNAYKFTEINGRIDVEAHIIDQQIYIAVKDTGVGISESQLEHIFDRFYQVDSPMEKKHEGTGIGLALVKELVELHQGTIKVDSIEGQGTRFVITLPSQIDCMKDEPSDYQVVEDELMNPTVLQPIHPNKEEVQLKPASTKAPLILVVEDHPDLQELIREELSAYRVIQAFDGKQGVEMALEHVPDFIISDVMMPHKNGFELCELLKNDQRTSHIPIVLLTARAEQEDKLHGLQLGADDYLAKPFDSRELKIRIDNLIQLREQLQQRFATKTELVVFKPEEVVYNSADQIFVDELQQLLEENYHKEGFGVDDFAECMNLSKRHLNRKLNAMMNSSASKLLQNYRLQKASELLHYPNLLVGEIGFKVGFSSRAYFNKCFRDKFGVTPKSYQLKQLELSKELKMA